MAGTEVSCPRPGSCLKRQAPGRSISSATFVSLGGRGLPHGRVRRVQIRFKAGVPLPQTGHSLAASACFRASGRHEPPTNPTKARSARHCSWPPTWPASSIHLRCLLAASCHRLVSAKADPKHRASGPEGSAHTASAARRCSVDPGSLATARRHLVEQTRSACQRSRRGMALHEEFELGRVQ